MLNTDFSFNRKLPNLLDINFINKEYYSIGFLILFIICLL